MIKKQSYIDFISECKNLLSLGYLDLLLGILLEKIPHEEKNILLLLSRLESLRDRIIKGIINIEHFNLEQNRINYSISLLIQKIEKAYQSGTFTFEPLLNKRISSQNLNRFDFKSKIRLIKHELKQKYFLQTLKSTYLFLLLDQYNYLLFTTDEQDNLLWGWSVSDPARKSNVTLKSQNEEPRAASLVVSSFVINGINSPISLPGLNLQSEDLVRGVIDSLKIRYSQITKAHGVFGTAKKTIAGLSRVRVKNVPVNCRHISAGIMISTRILGSNTQNENDNTENILLGFTNGLSKQILSAINYLMELEEWAVFSQDPSDGKLAQLDSGTASLVLEMLDLIPSINWIASFCDELIVEQKEYNTWREQTIRNGIEVLNRLKISSTHGATYFFWDYSIDKKRKLNYLQLKSLTPSRIEESIDLYYTTRNLYLLRNYLFDPKYNKVFHYILDRVKEIYTHQNYSLPTTFPAKKKNGLNFTNTIFFLNALLPDYSQNIPNEFENLVEDGINKLILTFNKNPEGSLKYIFDLRVDGIALLLRLLLHSKNFSKYISNYKNVKTFQNLRDSSISIQEEISKGNYEAIEDILNENNLSWFHPIIINRIVNARENWFDYFGLDLKNFRR